MDREAWQSTVHAVPKSQAWLNDNSGLNEILRDPVYGIF